MALTLTKRRQGSCSARGPSALCLTYRFSYSQAVFMPVKLSALPTRTESIDLPGIDSQCSHSAWHTENLINVY